MAKIVSFSSGDRERDRFQVHDEIAAKFYSFEKDGIRYFQMDTHGRDERENPGKLSQSVQLDAAAAKQLVEILKRTFSL